MWTATEKLTIPNKDILSWYFDSSKVDPERPIYIDAANPYRFYNLRTAKETIRRLIAGFRAIGAQEGDVVCIHSFNDIDYPIIVNGIVGFGGIYSGTNPGYQVYEMCHAIRAAKVKYILTEIEMLDTIVKAADETGLPRDNVFVLDHEPSTAIPAGFKSWRTLLDHGEEDWVRYNDETTCSSRQVARLFSSGTTGLPKAAVFTSKNFIAQHIQVEEWRRRPYEPRRLVPMPMFHVAIAPSMHFSPLKSGVQVYVMRRFEVDAHLRYIEKYKITDLPMVPPMVVALINSDLMKEYDLSSINFVSCGAAPLEKGPQARLKAFLREDAVFTQVWGMTETTCIAMLFPYPEPDFTGSVGRPGPGMDVKLVDDKKKDISGYGVRGELCIRGPTVIPGYLDEKATKESWDEDGFFHTGDICYCDKETKKWYIVDRKKELIKVRGFQVAPPELEAVLLSHPKIVDAGVIGVTFPGADSEYPRAYVVRRKGTTEQELDEEGVKAYLAERLSKFKRLDGGVVFVDEIPKNPSGKILKRVLRERAVEEIKRTRPRAKL